MVSVYSHSRRTLSLVPSGLEQVIRMLNMLYETGRISQTFVLMLGLDMAPLAGLFISSECH
jgi:hypothetical protein